MIAIRFTNIRLPGGAFSSLPSPPEVDIDDMVGLRTRSFRDQSLVNRRYCATRAKPFRLLARVRRVSPACCGSTGLSRFSNDDLLAFLPDCLVYCEHSNIGKYCLADEIRAVLTPGAGWLLRQHNINMVVRQNETAGVGVGRNIERKCARRPCGRIVAMKPRPLAATTLESRIGSPSKTGVRTMAPTKSLIASGRSVFLITFDPVEAAGQVCQPTSPSVITWAVSRSEPCDQHIDGSERRRRWGCLGCFRGPTTTRKHGGDPPGG